MRIMLLALFLSAVVAEAARPSPRNFRSLRSRQEQASGFSSSGTGISVGKPRTEHDAVGAAMPFVGGERKIKKIVFQGPKKGWGVTRKALPLYNGQGRKIATAPAGRLFTYNDVKEGKTSSYLVSIFDAPPQEGAANGVYLVDCTGVASYEGDSWHNVSPILVEKLVAYFSLLGSIEARKKAIAIENDDKNPHKAASDEAVAKYRDSLKRATELEQKMNEATGFRRNKIQEELRSLKYEQAQLRIAAQKAKAQADAWRSKNPELQQIIKNDAQIIELNEKLKVCQSDSAFMAMIPPED